MFEKMKEKRINDMYKRIDKKKCEKKEKRALIFYTTFNLSGHFISYSRRKKMKYFVLTTELLYSQLYIFCLQ